MLDELRLAPDPASHLRQARLRAHPRTDRAALLASDHWRICRAALEQCRQPPALKFT
ncbi:MAG: hypothetical protein KGJ52_03890 [Gammaproteobacteria bacterium]|nr:hypothetical protein [Gammaproteobacteria bacterium]